MIGGALQDAANRENLRLLILLRWIAAGGQVVTIWVVHAIMGIDLPVLPMLSILWVLVIWNLAAWVRWRSAARITSLELFFGLAVDVLALAGQLYLSGGASNPFASLFLLQVILGAVLLELRPALALALMTLVSFVTLGWAHRPLELPETGDVFTLRLQGVFLCFLLNAGLLLVFLTRIRRNLDRRDRGLAQLRQRAAEEDHVVRLGLLAAGAAHELGTPMATLSVILNDWKQMGRFRRDAEAREELATMIRELDRCKAIVSGILASSGEPRGEGAVRSTVRRFFDEAVGEWRQSRRPAELVYRNDFGDRPMVADLALRQALTNLLDNALEASPAYVAVTVTPTDGGLRMEVADRGPGFEASVLERLGSPYVTTRGRTGGGLGLFLVSNVVRKLGGGIEAFNAPDGGARVVVTLPLDEAENPS